MQGNRTSFWSKIWKSIIALSAVLGIISPTELSFSYWSLALLLVATIVLAVYWHAIDITKSYFRTLRDDVKHIKDKLDKLEKRMNKKGKSDILGTIAQIIGAVVLLYVLWLVVKAT